MVSDTLGCHRCDDTREGSSLVWLCLLRLQLLLLLLLRQVHKLLLKLLLMNLLVARG